MKILLPLLLLLTGAAPAVHAQPAPDTATYAATDSTYAKVPRSKDGLLHGTVKVFYTGGKKEGTIPYRKGLKEGVERRWYRSGKIRAEIPWEGGRENGLIRRYYPSGKILSTTLLHSGHLLDGRAYYESGEMAEKTVPAIKGVMVTGFYKNGKLLSETPVIDGKKEGVAKTYFESGLLSGEVTYAGGVKEGPERAYSPEGRLTKETMYRNGQALSVKIY